MRRLRGPVVLVLLAAVAVPQAAQAATSGTALRAADHARDRSDRSLVAGARSQRVCARAHPQRCAGRWQKLQRAGLRLEAADRRLASVSAATAHGAAARLGAHQRRPLLRNRRGMLRWSRIPGVRSYVLARSAPGTPTTYTVVKRRRLRPAIVPGQTVTYTVRSIAAGSAWSAPVRVAYAAKARRDARSAPIVGLSGSALSWTKVGRVTGYIVARSVPGQPTVFTSVEGTSLPVQPLPGVAVTYTVRTAIAGAASSSSVVLPPAPPAAAPQPTATASSAGASGSPFAGQRLYVDPDSTAAQAQRQLSQQGNSTDAALIGKIASQPTAKWFGDWSWGHGGTAGDVSWWVGKAAAAGTVPVLVAYDIPWRDCGQYSAGGASGPDAYKAFIDGMVGGIAGRKAAVIVEPDALAGIDCHSADEQRTYYELLNYAVTRLGSSPNTAVYLDAGHSTWKPAATMAQRLQQAGIARARGFSVNVSNFNVTANEAAYASVISAAIPGGSHAVIDTSRNGRGPGSDWCNPSGRGLGTPPTANTGNQLIDAYLWIKSPGSSDGTCNGGPAAGTWWTSYALGLAANAAF